MGNETRTTAEAPKLTKEQKAAAKEKAAKQKAAEQAKAAKAKVREQEKAAKAKAAEQKAAEQAKAQKAAEKFFADTAKEINYRLEQAEKFLDKADDHRLAAAIRLNDAKVKCAEVGLSFKKWAEEHIKDQTFETVRKLAGVGGTSDKDGGPTKALADMREKNKIANRAARAREKAKKTQTSKPENNISAPAKGSAPKNMTPFKVAQDALHALDTPVAAELVKEEALKLGSVVVPQEEMDRLKKMKAMSSWEAVVVAYSALKADEKLLVIDAIEQKENYVFVTKDVAAAGRKAVAKAA